jgi:hypothetical protein
VPHPTFGSGGRGAHSLAREGVEESQFQRGDIDCGSTFYIYVLCGKDQEKGMGVAMLAMMLTDTEANFKGGKKRNSLAMQQKNP